MGHRSVARTRRVAWFAALAALTLNLGAVVAAADGHSRITVDYIFLVDVSGSMDGKAGHVQIFPKVKTAVTDFLHQLEPGTSVTFIPFAEDVRQEHRFVLRSPSDVSSAVQYVNSLVADGQATAVYRSINYALEQTKQLRAQKGDAAVVVLYIYTDGDDTISRISLKDILQRFNLERGEYDWLFYTELGVPRSAEKEAEFDKVEHTRYVSEATGEVHPLMQVEPLLPVLNFGNLLADPAATRAEKFVARSTQPLPQNFDIKVEPVFDQVKQQGVLAEITPDRVHPDGKQVPFRISLLNTDSLKHGDYKGQLKLTSSDPLVLVIPDEIQASFQYETPHTIVVSTPPGQTVPFDFGAFRADRPPVLKRQLRLEYSPTARAAAEGVNVQLSQSASNPEPLRLGDDVSVSGAGKQASGTVAATQNEIELVVHPKRQLRPGAYSGTVELSSDADLTGKTLKVDPQSGRRTVDWKFVVQPPPTPPWVWIALAVVVLASLLGFVAWKRRPPVFGDLQVSILGPVPNDINLSRRHRATFGQHGDYATDSKIRFALIAEKADEGIAAMLDPIDGEIEIERSGAGKMPVVGKEQVYSDDVILFGPYRMQLSSYSLVNS